MLLPPHELEYFTHFKTDFKYGTDKESNSTCYDIITLYYSKEKTFLWMKYRKSWSKTYKFQKIMKKSKWSLMSGTESFVNQLIKIQDNQWTSIDPKVYEKIKAKCPEYFL